MTRSSDSSFTQARAQHTVRAIPQLVWLMAGFSSLVAPVRSLVTAYMLRSLQTRPMTPRPALPHLRALAISPAPGTSTSTGNMSVARTGHAAVLLADGRVMVSGGISGSISNIQTASVEMYDPVSGSFTAAGSLSRPVSGHRTFLLPNGAVFIA